MKEILYSVALILAANTGHAQEYKSTATTFLSVNYCNDYNTVVSELIDNYNETLLFYGDGIITWEDTDGSTGQIGSHTQMFVNQSTGTWSLIQVYDKNTTCFLTGGVGFEPYVD